MSETLFGAVSACSKDLMKFGFSVEEFAALVQKNNMADAEVLAVAKVFEYLKAKKDNSTVDFLLRTSRLPLKVPKPLTTLISAALPERMLISCAASLRCPPSMPTKISLSLGNRGPARLI